MGVDLKKPYEVYALSEPLACCLVLRTELGFTARLLGMEIRSLGSDREQVYLNLEVTRERK